MISRRKFILSLQIVFFLALSTVVANYGFKFQEQKEVSAAEPVHIDNTQVDLLMAKAKANIDQLDQDQSTNKASMKSNRFQPKTQLNLVNAEKASPGYTVYTISGPEVIYLLDLQGKIVHQWTGIDSDRTRLLPNGNILVLHGSKNLIRVPKWRALRNTVAEYNWYGEKVWSYTSDYVLHHDVHRLPNGNTLTLAKVPVPEEYLAKISDPLRRTVQLKSDSILEINKNGEIVYRWNAWEHMDINNCGVRECPGEHTKENRGRFDIDDFQDWTHLNTVTILPENKWYDGGDKRFKPGNFIIMPRNFWTMYIVDRETGKIVWEHTGDYKGGIVGGHEPQMIQKGFQGAGNIIVLDNGSNKRNNSSFILEINPTTKKAEWVYDVGPDFFTRARGSVQRLPNGNTLISEDRSGRVFEVTPEKEKVWEYKGNLLHVRAHRYPLDYSAKFQQFH